MFRKQRSQARAIMFALIAVPFVVVGSNRVHRVVHRFARRKGPADTKRNGTSTDADQSWNARQDPEEVKRNEPSRQPSVGNSMQAADISPGEHSAQIKELDVPLAASDAPERNSSPGQVTNEPSEMEAETDDAQAEQETQDLSEMEVGTGETQITQGTQELSEMEAKADDVQAKQEKNESTTDLIAEQTARKRKYITFTGEEESDYTRGLIRIVDAFDGVENVSSLLLNLDFSQKVQAAVQSQQELRAIEQAANGDFYKWRDLESQITIKVADLRIRILMADHPSDFDNDEDPEEDLPLLHKEVKKFEAFREAVQHQSRLVKAGIDAQKEHLLKCQESVNAYLEEAFVAAKLLKPAPADVEPDFDELDLDAMFNQYCNEMDEESPGWDAVEKLPGDAEMHSAATIPDDEDPVRQQKRQAQVTWQQAHLKFRKAQEAFDAREEDADQDRCRAEEAKEDLLDWSLRWVQRGRELTRALIEAEEEEKKAREAAEEAGVDVARHYQRARFEDHASDGYGSGYERGGIAQAPRERIFEWMSHIPDGEAGDPNKQELLTQPETDNWTYEDIAVNGSRSVIDDGLGREKIDSWSRACDRGGV
ncbi:hypothetical protein CBER1_10454 [Cercospora berteroae]|uniref:Uncharacterized protein n=1 Tax=Cercospora berteroae TaxID=357750 RepID=A0A2S6CGF0_9PEZI|nr:hypothetical protein CBER1_10454 [Cercospora berteroae]